jgi:hypothetical protein
VTAVGTQDCIPHLPASPLRGVRPSVREVDSDLYERQHEQRPRRTKADAPLYIQLPIGITGARSGSASASATSDYPIQRDDLRRVSNKA